MTQPDLVIDAYQCLLVSLEFLKIILHPSEFMDTPFMKLFTYNSFIECYVISYHPQCSNYFLITYYLHKTQV